MRHRGSFRVGQDPCTAPKTSLCAPSSGCQCMSTRTLPLRLAAVQHSAGSRVSSRHSSNRAHEALCVCSINARVCRSGIRRHSAASSDRSIALSLSSLERSSSLYLSRNTVARSSSGHRPTIGSEIRRGAASSGAANKQWLSRPCMSDSKSQKVAFFCELVFAPRARALLIFP